MDTQIDKKNEYTYKKEYSIVEGEYRRKSKESIFHC